MAKSGLEPGPLVTPGLAIGGKRAGASKQAVSMSSLGGSSWTKIAAPPGSDEVSAWDRLSKGYVSRGDQSGCR